MVMHRLKSLFLAGIKPEDEPDLIVACVTSNVWLILIIFNWFVWAIIAIIFLKSNFLFVLNFFMGVLSIFFYVAMVSGKRDLGRFGLLVLVSMYIIVLNIALVSGNGSEFYFVPLCFSPLVIFPRNEQKKIKIGLCITFLAVIITILSNSFTRIWAN